MPRIHYVLLFSFVSIFMNALFIDLNYLKGFSFIETYVEGQSPQDC